MASLSPAAAGSLVHPLSPQGPFPSDGERLNIKQEPEDREPTFRSIGLQDITLDDGNIFIYHMYICNNKIILHFSSVGQCLPVFFNKQKSTEIHQEQ